MDDDEPSWPFNKATRAARTKCVNGSTSPSACAQLGIPWNGNIKPDNSIEGRHGPLHRRRLAFGNRREESRLPFARRCVGRHDNRTRRLMLTLLGGLAEFERDPIRARTGEGRERAKASGQSLGRAPCSPRADSPIGRRDRGEPLGSIARSYEVSPSTISGLAARFSYPRLLSARPKAQRRLVIDSH